MRIVEPSVELWIPQSKTQHVARCARVCYGKETGNDKNTVAHLKACNHNSMFRHISHYLIIPFNCNLTVFTIVKKYNSIINSNAFIESNRLCGIDVKRKDGIYYIVTNGQWALEHEDEFNHIKQYEVSPETFSNIETGFNMMRYTFACITQISTSRELNRVSPNNIAEASTRYIYEDGSIVRPHWMTAEDVCDYEYDELDEGELVTDYIKSCENSFRTYKNLVEAGMNKQDARGVLPLDTRTKVVYTYSINEWREILNLRYYGTTGKPHNNAKIIAGFIRNHLMNLGYDFDKENGNNIQK